MKIFVFISFIVCLVTITTPVEVFADTALEVYMNDFYSKSNQASQILKEIEDSRKKNTKYWVQDKKPIFKNSLPIYY